MSTVSRQNVNTYSPEGRLHQVEYAMQAMNLGTSSIGIKTKEFGILVSEKKIISKLQISSSVRKHFKIYDHIVLGFSGISADVKSLVEKSRNFAINHEYLYDENCKVERLLEYLADLSLNFVEQKDEDKIFSRPFGASLLILGYDTEPKLFSLDPSGSYLEYEAKAIGSGNEVIENLLEKEFNNELDLHSSLKKLLNLLSKVMKEKINSENVEVTVVTKEGVRNLSSLEVEQFV